jgi:hypothetical protein
MIISLVQLSLQQVQARLNIIIQIYLWHTFKPFSRLFFHCYTYITRPWPYSKSNKLFHCILLFFSISLNKKISKRNELFLPCKNIFISCALNTTYGIRHFDYFSPYKKGKQIFTFNLYTENFHGEIKMFCV